MKGAQTSQGHVGSGFPLVKVSTTQDRLSRIPEDPGPQRIFCQSSSNSDLT